MLEALADIRFRARATAVCPPPPAPPRRRDAAARQHIRASDARSPPPWGWLASPPLKPVAPLAEVGPRPAQVAPTARVGQRRRRSESPEIADRHRDGRGDAGARAAVPGAKLPRLGAVWATNTRPAKSSGVVSSTLQLGATSGIRPPSRPVVHRPRVRMRLEFVSARCPGAELVPEEEEVEEEPLVDAAYAFSNDD